MIGSLILTSLITHRRFAPGSLRLPTNWRTALAATMRMVARVHDGAANGRTAAHMSCPSSLADALVLMIDVANLPNGRHTKNMHAALLARRQTQQRVIALFCHQLRACTRAARHLGASSSLQLNTVNGGASRNILQR